MLFYKDHCICYKVIFCIFYKLYTYIFIIDAIIDFYCTYGGVQIISARSQKRVIHLRVWTRMAVNENGEISAFWRHTHFSTSMTAPPTSDQIQVSLLALAIRLILAIKSTT